MEPTRDTFFTRIQAFFNSLGLFVLLPAFLLLVLGISALTGIFKDAEQPEDVRALTRYERKEINDAEQELILSQEQMDQAVSGLAVSLATTQPLAVEKPEQVIPGSKTAIALAEAPGPDLSEIDTVAEEEDAPIDPAIMEIGKAQFLVCGACHGQNGEGGPAGPPLADSEWVTGPISNLILIQLRGLQGPITVNGVEYNFPAGMTPMAYQTDEQVAAVLTYIRNSFGNQASAVKPEQVTALRGEVGKPQVRVEDLIQP